MKEGLSKEIVGPRKGFDRVTYLLYQGLKAVVYPLNRYV